jgi:hypothetical protein
MKNYSELIYSNLFSVQEWNLCVVTEDKQQGCFAGVKETSHGLKNCFQKGSVGGMFSTNIMAPPVYNNSK